MLGVDVGGRDVTVGVFDGLAGTVTVGAAVGSSVRVAVGVGELVESGTGDVAVGVGLGPGVLVGACGSVGVGLGPGVLFGAFRSVVVGSTVSGSDSDVFNSNPLVGSGLDGGRMLAC